LNAGATPRLRADLPFRNVALVLSGGGALGAYEVGVLRVLERLHIVPGLIVGVSVGAINALGWVASGYDATRLERVWRRVRGDSVGVQWTSLALRVSGALAAMVALLELVLTSFGSREFSGAYWLWRQGEAGGDLLSTRLDLAFWAVFGLLGLLTALFARRVARDLEARTAGADPGLVRRRLRNTVFVAAGVHLLVWVMGWPWPHRFSVSFVLLLALAWGASGPGSVGRWFRGLGLRLMPETGGRGLWGGRARRRLLDDLVANVDPARLVGPGTRLAVTALSIGSGRVVQFVSWPDPDPAFVSRIEEEHGEVVPVRDLDQLLQAAVGSSAIPGVFQPESVAGRSCIDAGGFSNQPLHVAIAGGADAVLAVLLSPSRPSPDTEPPRDLLGLGARLLELMNWRDFQTELRNLPPGWSRKGVPARVCVVEPEAPLPASLLTFDPARAGALIEAGERDAWRALRDAGWLEADSPA